MQSLTLAYIHDILFLHCLSNCAKIFYYERLNVIITVGYYKTCLF